MFNLDTFISFLKVHFNFVFQMYYLHPIKTISYIILLFIGSIVLKRINPTSWFFIIFTFPATVMHEITHLVLSTFTLGKPSKMNLIPKKNDNGIVFGYVQSNNIRYYNAIFIGLAPLILLYFGILFTFKYLIPETNILYSILYFYISLMLIEGGVPSSTDIKVSLTSWPLIVIGLGIGFWFFIKS